MISSEYKILARLGGPVLLTQLGSIVVSMADTIMVGAYGTAELAAAAFVNNLFTLVLVGLMGFAGGVTPLIGALYGAKKNAEAGSMLRVALKLNIYLSMIVLVLMCGVYFLLPYMGQPPELLPLIRPYYLIVLLSVVVAGIFFPCMQMSMGVTDTVTPMLIIIGANVLNIIGNYALIFGHWGAPELGLNGAGFSTFVARLLCTLVILLVIMRGKRYVPYRAGLFSKARTPSQKDGRRKQRRQMVRTSVPVMIYSIVECSLWTFGAVVCGWYGKEQLAAFQITLTLGQLGFMTYMSFATAVSIRVANLTGVSDMQGVRRTARAGLRINFGLAVVACLIMWLGGAPLLSMFTPDEAVIALAVTLIPPLILYQFVDAYQLLYVNALRGTSFVKPLIRISLTAYVVVGLPVMLFMASLLGMHAQGVYYSFSVALVVAALLYRKSFNRVTTVNA